MGGYRRLIHSLLSLSGILVLVLGVLVGPHEPAGAAVTLESFEATYSPDDAGIWVTWKSGSEYQTQLYEVRRAVASNDPADATSVYQDFPRDPSGFFYEWLDSGSNLQVGQTYFYWLYELPAGSSDFVLLSVGDQAYRSVVFGATTTPTATATATVTPTESSEPGTTGSSPTSTHTPTRQPTATQRATNTPTFTPVAPSNTPPFTPVPPTSTPMVLTNTPTSQLLSTPVAPSTPTSVLPTATLLVIQPTVTDLAATSDLGTQPEVVPAALAQNATATTLPQQVAQAGTRQTGETEVTREARPTATPRPTEAAGSASQVSTLLLVVGGGSLCGAGMLILVALFVWRRR